MNARLLLLTLPLLALPLAAAAPDPTEPAPAPDWVGTLLDRVLTSPLPAPPPVPVPAPEPPAVELAPPDAPEGGDPAGPLPNLGVKVEKLQAGRPGAEPGAVRIRAPFPAKPLATPPAGWHLELPASVPPIIHQVQLSPGSRVALTIRPQVLTPDTDGTDAFAVGEPGFDAALGYRQTNTVGAVLTHSVRQLDDDARRLGHAIDQLQQLLITLPKPAPKPEPEPPAKPKSSKKR